MEHKPNVQLLPALERIRQQGHPWVVYEGYDFPDTVQDIKKFQSAIAASLYCGKNQWGRDSDGSWVEKNFQVHSVTNLIEEIQQAHQLQRPLLVEVPQLEKLLADNHLRVHGFNTDEGLVAMAYGRVAAVSGSMVIQPMDHIRDYHIILHHHEHHSSIYEMGHTYRDLATHAHYDTAVKEMAFMSRELIKEQRGAASEMKLVGRLEVDTMKMDAEGDPLFNSGMVLRKANWETQGLVYHTLHSIDQPIDLRPVYFAAVHPSGTSLTVYNDRMEEVIPGSSLRSYADHSFRSKIEPTLVEQHQQRQATEATRRPAYEVQPRHRDPDDRRPGLTL